MMLPTNPNQWFFLVFYTFGAIGGILFLARLFMEKLSAIRAVGDDDQWAHEAYDEPLARERTPKSRLHVQWGPNAFTYEEPMPNPLENPISARRK